MNEPQLIPRPPSPGFYWWRQDAEDVWQVLQVRTDHHKPGELGVSGGDDGSYQGDNEPPGRAWHGQWWPVPIEPPAR